MTALWERDAGTLAGMIARRETSAAEVMAATLARIGAVNGAVNAIVSLRDEDALMAEARAADAGPVRGVLHGIPIAIKDLANVAGLPTTRGSPLFAGTVAAQDDTMVARLRAAGAIVIGKTNVPEFGMGSHTFNPVFGVTRNPFDLSRSAGGSSGGAAVALATGMLAVADGSDAMGSLRNPAAWNGVYGMRPSWALVPSEPEGEMFLHQLSTLGPMARTPQDMATLLQAMAGWDARYPHGRGGFDGADLRPAGRRRIGWLGDWGGAYPMDAGILEAAEGVVRRLEALGHDVETVAPPFPSEALFESWTTLRAWAAAGSLGGLDVAALKPEAQGEVARGRALTGAEVQAASVIRSDWFRVAARLFESYDALVLPATQVWPFPVEWRWPETVGGQAMDTYHRWMEVMVPVSLIGLPCVALPGGRVDGLPHGVQLFGPRGADRALLEIAAGWEAAREGPRVVTPGLT